MHCGLSTACFYPLETQQSLREICGTGVKMVEVFLNTFCELDDEYVMQLQRLLRSNHISVSAVHPFTSMMESFFFASDYLSRFEDGVQLYRRYFRVCHILEAPVLVFHGEYQTSNYPFALYCKNYNALRNIGKEYGVSLCQENVARCKCGYKEKILQMRKWTEDNVEFVLDLKQVRRAENDLTGMISAMDGKIRHVHLSDASALSDCIPPGLGNEPWPAILADLNRQPCNSMVIELYRDGFQTTDQLETAVSFIDSRLNRKG